MTTQMNPMHRTRDKDKDKVRDHDKDKDRHRHGSKDMDKDKGRNDGRHKYSYSNGDGDGDGVGGDESDTGGCRSVAPAAASETSMINSQHRASAINASMNAMMVSKRVPILSGRGVVAGARRTSSTISSRQSQSPSTSPLQSHEKDDVNVEASTIHALSM